jgi:hypothetical protein
MKHGRLKWFWAMAVAVMLGGGLTVAASTPALAVNNFIINWASVRGHGSIDIPCNHGTNSDDGTSFAATLINNCDVRVWVYPPAGIDPGGPQCVNPDSSAPAAFAEISRIYISDNPAKC